MMRDAFEGNPVRGRRWQADAWLENALRADVREADAALAPLHRLRLNAIGSVWSRHAWQSPPATATQR